MFIPRDRAPTTEVAPGLTRRLLAQGERLTVCTYEFAAAGIEVPEHHHAHEQVSYVLQGNLRYWLGGEELRVGAGDTVMVAPHTPHAVQSLEPCLVVDTFSPAREDYLTSVVWPPSPPGR